MEVLDDDKPEDNNSWERWIYFLNDFPAQFFLICLMVIYITVCTVRLIPDIPTYLFYIDVYLGLFLGMFLVGAFLKAVIMLWTKRGYHQYNTIPFWELDIDTLVFIQGGLVCLFFLVLFSFS